MNTNNIKQYAPKARNQFIQAISERLAHLGISKKGISHSEIKGDMLYIDGYAHPKSIAHARELIAKNCMVEGQFSKDLYHQYVEHIAYTWFNRFCALRYMELHGYLSSSHRLLSNPDSESSHHIEALMPGNVITVAKACGIIDMNKIQNYILDNKIEALYRELLFAECNKLNQSMPFMFDRISTEQELLLPANLTSTQSILRDLINDIPEDDWQQVEIIGWLYQYYISERKDEVIGKTVKSEDIPAATQLFTPNWIVKYLVQNSVGQYWMQTYPESTLRDSMEYYITPAEQEPSVVAELKKITPDYIDPETITVLDPACGSGHILLEAYNVLKEIYRDSGYLPNQIPRLILEKNIYGLDIDDRAAQLASFAVMMIALKDDRTLLDNPVKLNILSLQESKGFDLDSHWANLTIADPDNKYQPLFRKLMMAFEEAKTFGSLIKIDHDDELMIGQLEELVNDAIGSGDGFREDSAKLVLPILKQAQLLAKRYDSVVANPPYLSRRSQEDKLKKYLQDHYKNMEIDLFSAFIICCSRMSHENGYYSLMTPQVWMFLSTFEPVRLFILENQYILNLIELPLGGFEGAMVQIGAFSFRNRSLPLYKGKYFRLTNEKGGEQLMESIYLKLLSVEESDRVFLRKGKDFKYIPNHSMGYWLSDDSRNIFHKTIPFKDKVQARQGLATADNNQFLRLWHEVSFNKIGWNFQNSEEALEGQIKWVPYNKGGEYRKWYGNHYFVVNWENDGEEIKNFRDVKTEKIRSRPQNLNFYFKESVSWSDVTSGSTSFRYFPKGFIFDVKGMSAHHEDSIELSKALLLANSKIVSYFVEVLNPTISFQAGNFNDLPLLLEAFENTDISTAQKLVEIHKDSWDQQEISREFKKHWFLLDTIQNLTDSYDKWRETQVSLYEYVKQLEEKNNSYFIEAYGLTNELTAELEPREITLNSNPYYRYPDTARNTLEENVRLNRFQSDTITELLSYILGCTMGRYSLDREGLIYAHAGNVGFKELVDDGAYATFPADKDGFIPLMSREEGWFSNDATQRVYDFVKTVWGEELLEGNLQFIADSLNLYALKPRKGETSLQTIERYFTTQFYKDHCSMYQKTPIYWLVSSGKEKAFECLFYLHRYNESTFSKMRMDYVIPLLGRFDQRLKSLQQALVNETSTAEKNRLDREIKALEKKQIELVKFDENIRSIADAQIALDLDDGVKVNYAKFGTILAKI